MQKILSSIATKWLHFVCVFVVLLLVKKKMEEANFGAPIPGQSLFTPPKDRPWENPSELDTVDQALGYYFTNLRDPDIIDDIMTVVDMGIPLEPSVKTLYISSVMNGIHNLDVGLIVAPVLTEFLAAVAKSYEID